MHSDSEYESDDTLTPHDYDPYMSDSFELPPQIDIEWFSKEPESVLESAALPKKRGRKVVDQFPFPPLGEHKHPHIGWIVDKAALDKFVQDYAKQEGTALIAMKERGNVIRYRCIHGGKYNNHRNLPAEVTDKDNLQQGIITLNLFYKLMCEVSMFDGVVEQA